jgi:hypothetical protein
MELTLSDVRAALVSLGLRDLKTRACESAEQPGGVPAPARPNRSSASCVSDFSFLPRRYRGIPRESDVGTIIPWALEMNTVGGSEAQIWDLVGGPCPRGRRWHSRSSEAAGFISRGSNSTTHLGLASPWHASFGRHWAVNHQSETICSAIRSSATGTFGRATRIW